MRLRLLAALLVPAFAVTTAAAEEICHEMPGGQFADERFCVTSVRTPEGEVKFGPENLLATGDGAWCAGSPSKQVITNYFKPKPLFRMVNIVNGYAKSEELFRQNGRIRRALLEADNGYRSTITLRDSPKEQRIIIPKGRYGWIRLTVIESIKGHANAAICLSALLANLEELANN